MANKERKPFDELNLPWRVEGDLSANPPMIWDASGDSIVNQMEDGTPYFEPEIAAFIVKAAAESVSRPDLEKVAREIAGGVGELVNDNRLNAATVYDLAVELLRKHFPAASVCSSPE